ENLGLEDKPEGLDLAVGPGRVDLGAQVVDVQLLQPPAKAREHVGHPGDKGLAVVAHQLQGLAAELEAVLEPAQDRRRVEIRVDAQADYETRVVVDDANDPGLDVAACGQPNEERPLDVDVPELVRTSALVARTTLSHRAATRTALGGQQAVD